MDQNRLCNFGTGHYQEYFCEIIFNLDQCFKEMSFKVLFLDRVAILLD